MRSINHSLSALAGVALVAGSASAQAPQVRTLPAPDATYEEPFTALSPGTVRELRNGKLIVSDPRDKTLQLVDLAAGSATKIGREGSGPAEFGLPMRVFSAPGDTTFLYDPGNSRLLTVLPDGKPGATFRMESETPAPPRGDRAPATPVAPPGGAPGGANRPTVVQGGGAPGGIRFAGGLTIPRASDARGNLYYEGQGITLGPNGPTSADSTVILRWNRSNAKVDTVAWVMLPKNNVQTTQAPVSGGGQNFSMRIGGANPLVPRDEWAVFPDGRVAIARATGYRVDVVGTNGTLTRGTPIRYTPIKVTPADIKEEEALRVRQQNNGLRMTMTNDGGSERRSMSVGGPANGPPPPPLTDWPDVKPPFRSGMASVWARPNGELWVRRMEPAGAKGTLYDVVNAGGTVTHQVRIPDGMTMVGMGNGTIYTIKLDEDDLQYLQRHRIS